MYEQRRLGALPSAIQPIVLRPTEFYDVSGL